MKWVLVFEIEDTSAATIERMKSMLATNYAARNFEFFATPQTTVVPVAQPAPLATPAATTPAVEPAATPAPAIVPKAEGFTFCACQKVRITAHRRKPELVNKAAEVVSARMSHGKPLYVVKLVRGGEVVRDISETSLTAITA
jgi:hypothetical protein